MEALISFFVKYLLVPLLAVVMLFVVNKLAGIKKKIQVKKVIIFVLIVVLILTLPSLFALLKMSLCGVVWYLVSSPISS